MSPDSFRCYLVERDESGKVSARMAERRGDELPEGEVTLRVAYSSLNYKDALGATGHPGINRKFPHIPGVDAAGVVVESGVYELVEGDEVIVTGFDMGANRWGGWGGLVRVPQSWVVPLPEGLTLRESMMLGTAGLTAAMCVDALVSHGVEPRSGEVVVTGASGGVGGFAVAILAKLGYRVAAVTGKLEAHDYLRSLGAAAILGREDLDDRSDKPLLSRRWAGGVDTVGSSALGTMLRATQHGGCVAACGMAAGTDLPITVYPFILRGVTLSGVDAAWCKDELRHRCWQRLAGPWKPDGLEAMCRFVSLEHLPQKIEEMLAGRVVGRYGVEVSGE